MLVVPVPLADGVGAWFTGRGDGPQPAVGVAGNLSHRRPHVPAVLAADRQLAGERMGLAFDHVHLMRQVHGRSVAIVDATTPLGAELPDVDGMVTVETDRALAVQVADCVPVLFAARSGPIGVAHAGRRGVELGIVPAVLAALAALAAPAHDVHAVVGPAIGGCCYEVPSSLRDPIAARHPAAASVTTWGSPSLDLPAAVEAQLERAGVASVERFGGCTRCDAEARWFSHRGDPGTGRQIGVVVRQAA